MVKLLPQNLTKPDHKNVIAVTTQTVKRLPQKLTKSRFLFQYGIFVEPELESEEQLGEDGLVISIAMYFAGSSEDDAYHH